MNDAEPGHNINIKGNEGNSTDDDIDDIEHYAPEPPTHPHTTHDTTDIFAGTSSGHQSHDGNDYASIKAALDNILSEMWHHNTLDVEHDQLIKDMHSQ